MEYFRRRKARKTCQDVVRHVRHIRNMRGDILDKASMESLAGCEEQLVAAMRTDDAAMMESVSEKAYEVTKQISPPRSQPGLRENLEILVVAVAVAMAFRCYFIQPFKIPTGSMQPTLFGIHSEAVQKPSVFDKMPLKLAKWFMTGKWYREVKVRVPGTLTGPFTAGSDNPSVCYYYVGPNHYTLPRDASINFRTGSHIESGSVLWAGIVTAGDHVFVDRVRWNFSRPKRGSVMVFVTDGIPTLPVGTHYIKRLIGMPNDTINIDPPNVLIDGVAMTQPDVVGKISRHEPPYDVSPYNYGYIPPRASQGGRLLLAPNESLKIAPRRYFGLGDNTDNSADGRYWGTVPEPNLVGPAFMVYWPFSSRWGSIK